MNHQQARKNEGFALIEVMLSALLLTVGCLAFLKLQQLGLQYAFNDYARSQGIVITQSFAERLRSNLALLDTETFDGSIKSDAIFTRITFPSRSPECKKQKPGLACARVMFAYQSYLTARQMQHLIKGNSILCYQRNATNRTLIRLTFLWVDNSSETTSINCPTSFNGGSNINNMVTLYVQL